MTKTTWRMTRREQEELRNKILGGIAASEQVLKTVEEKSEIIEDPKPDNYPTSNDKLDFIIGFIGLVAIGIGVGSFLLPVGIGLFYFSTQPWPNDKKP